MSSPEEFGQVVLHAKVNGSVVYLANVARLGVGQLRATALPRARMATKVWLRPYSSHPELMP